jgi:hypothetical protein
MPSALPTEDASDKSVDPFGIGTYDYPQWGGEHGEDSNKKKSQVSLPDGGGTWQKEDPELLISYPQSTSTASSKSQGSHDPELAYSTLPGDYDTRPRGPTNLFLNPTRPMTDDHSDDHSDDFVTHTNFPKNIHTNLPSDSKNPPARSDYYDPMVLGTSVDDMFAPHSGDTFAEEEASKSDSLPSIPENKTTVDNTLGALGNYWSGYNVQDQNVDAGFPSMEYWDIGRYQQLHSSEIKQMNKIATNVVLVRDLTSEFIKKFGKKDLTRRHVMAFLQERGEHVYLASDIIRAVALEYDIFIKDVLDEFPVRKASTEHRVILSTIRSKLIDFEIQNINDPEASQEFRYAAAALSKVLAVLSKYEV